jgi:hypothetical protein
MPSDASQQERLDVEFPVSFTGDAKGKGIVRNLSTGGCKIESDVAVHGEMLLVLRLWVPGDASQVVVDVGAVRWVAGGCFGIQFLVLQENEQNRINRYLETLSVS